MERAKPKEVKDVGGKEDEKQLGDELAVGVDVDPVSVDGGDEESVKPLL